MSKFTDAEELLGTCDTASPELTEVANGLSIYRCDTCGWWHDEGDIYSVDECTDCHNGE